MESNNTTPKEILENIISVMEKTRVDDWEIDKLVVVLNYINELEKENINIKLQLLENKISLKDVEYQEKTKLQQRIDKAIEYIKTHSKCGGSIQNGEFIIEHIEEVYNGMELLSILRGEDNE